MVIRFFDTLQKFAEKEVVLQLSHPIMLQELIEILSKKYPALVPLIQKKNKAELYTPIMFLRNSCFLKFTDVLKNDDTILVVEPAVGG
jgi:hypothetical protein